MKQEKNKDDLSEQTKEPSRGILLIALGNPHYGRMVANLAASLRFVDREVKIHLVHNETSITHLTAEHLALFTSMAECPKEYYTKNGKEVFLKAKTCAYQLSPFDETILMDVDLVWFGRRRATNLLQKLSAECDFTMQNRGYYDLSKENPDEAYCRWCNIAEVKEKYETNGKFYLLASEFVFFKKNDANKKYFALVREIFDNPKVKAFKFDTDIPDELAFNIASTVLAHYPYRDGKVFIYWYAMDGRSISFNDVADKYYGYSIGGSVLPPDIMKRYNMMVKAYQHGLKLKYLFNVQPKRTWSPQRATI